MKLYDNCFSYEGQKQGRIYDFLEGGGGGGVGCASDF